MKLVDWLDGYRNLPIEEVTRRSAEAEEDWEEQDLFAAPDRLRNTSPRWLERTAPGRYGGSAGADDRHRRTARSTDHPG